MCSRDFRNACGYRSNDEQACYVAYMLTPEDCEAFHDFVEVMPEISELFSELSNEQFVSQFCSLYEGIEQSEAIKDMTVLLGQGNRSLTCDDLSAMANENVPAYTVSMLVEALKKEQSISEKRLGDLIEQAGVYTEEDLGNLNLLTRVFQDHPDLAAICEAKTDSIEPSDTEPQFDTDEEEFEF